MCVPPTSTTRIAAEVRIGWRYVLYLAGTELAPPAATGEASR